MGAMFLTCAFCGEETVEPDVFETIDEMLWTCDCGYWNTLAIRDEDRPEEDWRRGER